LTELCGHIRRYSDLICKYPRKDFERRRTGFLDEMRAYAEVHLGAEAADEVARETALIALIEHGYRGILDVLGRCAIGQRPAAIRVSGSISRACHEYQELMSRRDKAMAESTELNLMSGLRLQDDNGQSVPLGLPDQIATLIAYRPEDEGLSEREVYDYLANTRLHDRLIQTFMEMEIESGLSGQGVGIAGGAALPPAQLVSTEEAHAGVSLSEVLGYSIVEDEERPEGLRLLEWVRGYIVLKEIAKARTQDQTMHGDSYIIRLEKAELLGILQACGLKDDAAACFIALTCLHRSARDMFDCPLVRVGASGYVLFAPAVIDLNVAMVVLSNLSNRGAELGRKGKAFEHVIHEVFRKRGVPVFGFRVRRGSEEYEYDAIVPWDGYLFVFECKNRSISGNDPAQAYYFDLEVASQARQVRRLADALIAHPDIIEQEMGPEYGGLTIIPCVLHSMPYSRADDIDGVHFTDWSALTRFFDQPYFRIKVPHRVGNATLLHRTAIRKFWKGDTPTADDFLEQLRNPFQLELSMKHLDFTSVQFAVSEPEIAVTAELVRTEMTTRSVSEAVGVDADKVLQEIAAISEQAKALRSELERRAGGLPKSGPVLSGDL
jgi:hypothetical protein